MVSAMRFMALVATLTLASSSSWGADAAAAKVACTDSSVAADYSAVQSKRSACEAASGVVMALPLTAKQKKSFCTACPELLAMTQAKSLPKCTVTSNGEVINLQQEMNRLFKPCLSGDSSGSADSGAGGSDSTTSPAATVAPGGSDTTTPATTETPKTKTPKPSKTKKNGASATGSSDDDGDDSTAATPKTKAPKTPKPSKSHKTSAAGASADDDGSTAIESSAGNEETESSSSTESLGSLSGLPATSNSSSSRSEVSSKANATSDATIRTAPAFSIVVAAATFVLMQ